MALFLEDVAEQHLSDAEFLVEQWTDAAVSVRFNFNLLRRTIEPRLLAHVDALAIGGRPVADAILEPLLAEDGEASPGHVTVAALALLLDPDNRACDRLIERLWTTGNASVRKGLAQAFALSDRPDIAEPLRLGLYASSEPAAQAALLDVLTARRVDAGPILAALLRRRDPVVLPSALAASALAADRAAVRTGVENELASEVPAVRAAALRTALVWNLAGAWRQCLARAQAGEPDALLHVGCAGGQAEIPILARALASPAHRKSALFALGFTGRREAVEACLPWLGDEDAAVARLAGEAFTCITGLALDVAPFCKPRVPATDDLEPVPVEDDPEVDQLPLPDGAAVANWWSEHQASLTAGVRYLCGERTSAARLQTALLERPLRWSSAFACEIAIRTGGRVQLPALRLNLPAPTVPGDVLLERPPRWV